MFAPANSYVPQYAAAAAASRGALAVWAMVAGAALCLVGLIVGAPLLLAHGHASAATTIYEIFGKVCHQLPERSFQVEGHQFAVCSRCTGLYAGFALSVLLYPLSRSLKRIDTPRRLWLLLATVPLLVDWSLGFFDIWANTHLSRFLTGGLFGAVAAIYVVPGLIDLGLSVWRRLGARSPGRNARGSGEQERAAPLPRSAPSDYGSPSSRI
ncbi:MAG TPA: DUF2085 domain-containing protein [Pyrinomonadaceae bacterium]|jgi:uncharacterized membrane protein|nr:DUF2085 domain-containing protein [Pyrinomonadaceae bacterium]